MPWIDQRRDARLRLHSLQRLPKPTWLRLRPALCVLLTPLLCVFPAASGVALQTDRQQPLLVDADATEGTLGDGKAYLRGNVEIRQGTLLVRAEQAEVEKADGRVRSVVLTGAPVLLQQEIEQQGQVTATAQTITYQVASGIVTLQGNADVDHPQYQISGDELVYDLNQQHFEGRGGQQSGRIRIQLEPEVLPDNQDRPAPADSDTGEPEPARASGDDAAN